MTADSFDFHSTGTGQDETFETAAAGGGGGGGLLVEYALITVLIAHIIPLIKVLGPQFDEQWGEIIDGLGTPSASPAALLADDDLSGPAPLEAHGPGPGAGWEGPDLADHEPAFDFALDGWAA